ncbi:MAG: tetratricopeptide repeat protein [Chthoniobacterales bacterium]
MNFPVILRLLLLSLLMPLLSRGQDATPTPEAIPATTAIPTPAPTATPDPKPKPAPVDPIKSAQYQTYLRQSGEYLEKKHYQEALKYVQKAEEIFGSNASTLNLRGAIMVGEKKYDQATNLYTEALKLNPGFFAATYNLGDIEFQKGDYTKAADYFKKMLAAYPGNELLQFMIFLCYIQLNNTPEAQKWMNGITFPSNSPSWYYARAVWELKNGNKSEAADYLRGSAYIFGDQNQIFNETLNNINLLPIK